MNLKVVDAYILDDFNPYVSILKSQLEGAFQINTIKIYSHYENLLHALKHYDHSKIPLLFLEYYNCYLNFESILSEIKTLVRKPKIIILSSITNSALLKNIVSLNPDGIIHKTDNLQVIINCIMRVLEGKTYYSDTISEILRPLNSTKKRLFTSREIDLLQFWARGYTVEKTAKALSLSTHTIIAHRRNMFRKINCTTIDELLEFSISKKIIG